MFYFIILKIHVKISTIYFQQNLKHLEFKQESPADAGIPARRKNDEKNPPFRSYNKFQSSRKSGVYSNQISYSNYKYVQ